MKQSRFFRVRQHFGDDPEVPDIDVEVSRAIEASGVRDLLRSGPRIALTGGSRGITDLPRILRAAGRVLGSLGAEPFVVTAMGSHGGGTEEGQLAVLRGLGVTSETVGMPVRSTMETREVGTTPEGLPVYMDALVCDADGVFIVNRVKKHTDFHGELESGLCKMMTVGLGKVRQADRLHAHRPSDFPGVIESVARIMINSGKVLGGMAIIENRSGRTAALHGLAAREIPEREKGILKDSYRYFATLPFDEADLLIVRNMGKNISGCGMDPNVIGRIYIEGEPEPEKPFVQLIGVLDLREESDGNAIGVGMADFTTRRLVDSIDLRKTNLNAVTSSFPRRGKIPISLASDRELMEVALRCVQSPFREQPRIAIIEDTSHLESLLVSQSLLGRLAPGSVERSGEVELEFDADGRLR